MRAALIGVCGLAAALAATGAGGAAPETTAEKGPAPGGAAEGSALFDRSKLVAVSIEMDPADWDRLRNEHHDLLAALGPSRFDRPEANPYKVYPARVVINGSAAGRVGLRKRGFLGSTTPQRPSLGIRFDEFEAEGRFQGLRRMSLNNNLQDPSQAHQMLAYRVFAAAGVAAPRCSLAVVSVNGRKLGLYTHVEAIEEGFLKRRFGDADGNLYEGQISDFRPEWVKTFQRKNHQKQGGRADLEAVVKALAAGEGQWLEQTRQAVDLEQYLTFWAVEVLIGHWDSYSTGGNNFHLYRQPATGRFVFIPWGADSVFGDPNPFQTAKTPESVQAGMILPHRLYHDEGMRERYRQRLREVLDRAWGEEQLLAETDRLEAMAAPHIQVSEGLFRDGLKRVREFIRTRREVLEKELAGPAPAWPLPPKKSGCLQKSGVFSAHVSTTWLGVSNNATNTQAQFMLSAGGRKRAYTDVRILTGPARDPRYEGSPTITLIAPEWKELAAEVPVFLVRPEFFKPGARLTLDCYDAAGILLRGSLMEFSVKSPGLLLGTMELKEAGTKPGDRIIATVTADVYRLSE